MMAAMGYRVRSADGELRFQSLYEIERSLAQGLVGPDDELTEDGPGEAWRKISSVPALKATRPPRPPRPFWRAAAVRWVLPLCALLLATLALLSSQRYWLAGLALALFTTALLGQFTYKVFTRRGVR